MNKDSKALETDASSVKSGLRLRLLLLMPAVYLLVVTVAFFGFRGLIRRVTEPLGRGYAKRYALSNRALIQEPLTREISLVRQMAESPALKDWARNETDQNFRAKALAELENYRRHLQEKTWFCVINAGLNYYYDDGSEKYDDSKLVYTLKPDVADDAWYFATIRDVAEYALNVNYDRALDTRKVWINAVMRTKDGVPLGIVGTGLDLTGFLNEFIDRSEPGVQNIILDRRMAIQAHPDRGLIDLQSVAKVQGEHSTIERILLFPEDIAHFYDAAERLRAGSSSESVAVRIDGKRHIAGISYVENLDWYIVSLLDINTVISKHIFVPVFIMVTVIILLLVGVLLWITNKMIITPISAITVAAQEVSRGVYSGFMLPDQRKDEIGVLARTFNRMSENIRDNTEFLEGRVAERTAELNEANRELNEHARQLEEALARVRTLQGMLPICSHCKKVRDDKGYWEKIEHYIYQQTGTEFSHGICPECAHKLYPEVFP